LLSIWSTLYRHGSDMLYRCMYDECSHTQHNKTLNTDRELTELAKICIRRMRISSAKSVGCGCGCRFVAQTKLVPAIKATEI